MRKQYQPVSAEDAVKVIKSGDHVHISSVSSVPQCLVKALCDRGRAGELKNVYIHHLHTEGAAPYVNPEFEGIFQHNAFFVGANVRESVQKGLADYIPVFLGERITALAPACSRWMAGMGSPITARKCSSNSERLVV